MVDKTMSAVELPRLAIQLPDGKEVHHPIVGTVITIGRDPTNRIPIADQFVSKFHAKLMVSDSSMTLVDLGSANKTYVNGEPIREAAVKIGDQIQFAGVRCRILPPEIKERARAAAPPPTPPAKPAPVAKPPAPPPTPGASPAIPRSKPAPAGHSAPPRIEADPMKRLLRIGGLLILVSAALATLLRVLLVPSGEEEPPSSESAPAAVAPVEPAPMSEAAPPPAVTTTAPVATSAGGSTAEDHFDQALSFLDTGRLKDAQGEFRKVLALDPNHARARTRLSLLDEEIAKKAEQHFGNARQAFQYLRYEEAIAEWEMFLTLADSTDVRYAEAEHGIQQAKAKLR